MGRAWPVPQQRVDHQFGVVEPRLQRGEAAVAGGVCAGEPCLDRRLPLGVVAGREGIATHGTLPFGEMAGRHQAVTAVVARAHENKDPPLRDLAELHPGLLRNGQPGVGHQGVHVDACGPCPSLQIAHLGAGHQFHDCSRRPAVDSLDAPTTMAQARPPS